MATNARTTQVAALVIKGDSDTQKSRTTQIAALVIYYPGVQAPFDCTPVGFGTWDGLAPSSAPYDIDPVGTGWWLVAPPTASDFDCNPEGTGAWAVVVILQVGAFAIDPEGTGEWEASVGGDGSFSIHPVGTGEWLPHLETLATKCIAAPGTLDAEQNYVF